MEWKNIVNLDNLKFEPGEHKDNYLYDTAPAATSSAVGAKKLGWNVSILRPGQFSCHTIFTTQKKSCF